MSHSYTIKINFTGGIVSPGQLQNMLEAAYQSGIRQVRFGLRQQLLMDVLPDEYETLQKAFLARNISFDFDTAQCPNIMSSYPAEDVFLSDNWLSEGIYKDIFDGFDYRPQLKINISDNNQSFTPFFTGNINWIASTQTHFWYLYVRFPKTNSIYLWKDLIYSNDIAPVSKTIEDIIWQNRELFYAKDQADGEQLYQLVTQKTGYISKPIAEPLELPAFRLPYYEGFNRYENKTWLGIYRRDEFFSISFLHDLCKVCLQTKIGQICITPWKSLIIKGIEDKNRLAWDKVLNRHQINVRHAAIELNWQVEDNSLDGLKLKHDIVNHLNRNDLRTFGVCFGIQTRPKSEVFGSIIIRRKPGIRLGSYVPYHLYDILYTEDFNPNSRKLFVFEKNLPKSYVGEHIRRICKTFLRTRIGQQTEELFSQPLDETLFASEPKQPEPVFVHQCSACGSVYDAEIGEPENGIEAGITFEALPDTYTCPLCEARKNEFVRVEKQSLYITT